MWQGGEGQRGPGAEIDGPLCPPLRPRPGALCAGAAETCWVLFPILGAQGKRRGVRGPLIRASRAGQPECRVIIATCSAISLDRRGRGRPRPPSPTGPAAGSPVACPVPGRPVPPSPRRSRGGGGRAAAAVRGLPSPAAGAGAAPGRAGHPQSSAAAAAVRGTAGGRGTKSAGSSPVPSRASARPRPSLSDVVSSGAFLEPARRRRPKAGYATPLTQRCPPGPPHELPMCVA